MDFKSIKDTLKEKIIDFISYNANADDEEKYNKKRNILIALGITLVTLLLVVGIVVLSFKIPNNVQLNKKQDVVYVRINPGMGSDEIGQMLVDKGVISSKFRFWLTSKLNRADAKFKVGTYAMNKSMSAGDAISVLLHNKTVAVRVTIPEGFNVQDIAKRLDENGICNEKDFLKLAKTYTPYSYMEKASDAIYSVAFCFLTPMNLVVMLQLKI